MESSTGNNSPAPGSKATSTGIAGALSILLVWAGDFTNIDITPEVGAAITAVLMCIVAYFVPEKRPSAYRGPTPREATHGKD